MGQHIRSGRIRRDGAASPLMVRLDKNSKALLARAAKLRGISISDYVRTVTVPLARREVRGAEERTIAMSPEELRSFWAALNETPKLTSAQKRLGAIMRGEA